MGKVEAFAVPAIDLWFNSNDHREPHLHAKRPGEWEIRVFLNETASGHLCFEVKFGSGPSGRLQRELAALVVAHRVELLVEWELKVQSEVQP